MKKSNKIIGSVLLLLLLTLFITNPAEEAFLEQVAEDYGSMHHGLTLNTQQLQELGESYSQSYFLFSVHIYQFGSISVSYVGILGNFIKADSQKKAQEEELRTV